MAKGVLLTTDGNELDGRLKNRKKAGYPRLFLLRKSLCPLTSFFYYVIIKNMETVIKTFEELTVNELYEILKLRSAVFVVEQNCVYQDVDDVDQEAYHVYLKDEGKIVAYLRVVDKGKRLDEVSLGRVISLRRRCGLGTALMRAGIEVAKEKFGAKRIKIGAQAYAKPFYEGCGFQQISGEYLEDGIPHIYMLYQE